MNATTDHALLAVGIVIIVLLVLFALAAVLLFRSSGRQGHDSHPFLRELMEVSVRSSESSRRRVENEAVNDDASSIEPPLQKETYDDLVLDPKLRVTFCTDVEGNWEYFLAYVRRSEALKLVGVEDGGSVARIDLVDGWRLIFGGDACDKGRAVGGSVRVCRSLLLLKRRYPARVTILLGNRDLNKMRLSSELQPTELAENVLSHLPGPYWVPEAKRVSPLAYLRRRVGRQLGVAPEEVDDEAMQRANTMANRLRYILAETMGADGELERRAAELDAMSDDAVAALTTLGDGSTATARSGTEATEAGAEGVEAEEEARIIRAVASFRAAVAEGGFYRELIRHGQLGALVGDSLFVHGGLVTHGGLFGHSVAEGTTAYGHVPGRVGREEDVRAWLRLLHAWKEAEVADWLASPHWSSPGPSRRPSLAEPVDGGVAEAANLALLSGKHGNAGEHVPQALSPLHDRIARRIRGGEALISYVVPGTGPSVVMARHLDGDGMPLHPPEALIRTLNMNGVRRVVCGHTPHGNCPTVIKTGGATPDAAQLEVILADTSYSDVTAADSRGCAVAEVVLYPDSTVRVLGVLQDASLYDYTLGTGVGKPDELVGMAETAEHARAAAAADALDAPPRPRFVKAQLADGRYLMCRVTDGFKYSYSQLDAHDTQKAVGFRERLSRWEGNSV